jgi:hypothetical protein
MLRSRYWLHRIGAPTTARQIAVSGATAAVIIAVLATSGSFKQQNSATGPNAASKSTAAVEVADEAARRKSVLNSLIAEYIQSHPDAPVGWSKVLIAAEPYINERLDKMHETFRFDASNERFVDRK